MVVTPIYEPIDGCLVAFEACDAERKLYGYGSTEDLAVKALNERIALSAGKLALLPQNTGIDAAREEFRDVMFSWFS